MMCSEKFGRLVQIFFSQFKNAKTNSNLKIKITYKLNLFLKI